MKLTTRRYLNESALSLEKSGVHPLLAKIYAGRKVSKPDDLDLGIDRLIPFSQLMGCVQAAKILADTIDADQKILVIADYDCDGATACSVAVSGLKMLGARNVDFLVPNRFKQGYGPSVEVVEIAAKLKPDWIVTVDQGISSVEGVNLAKSYGINVLITDHHLPAKEAPPAADCIVNPNQRGDTFPSKSLAGVGVMFYVILALRAEFRARGRYEGMKEPPVGELLDLVALGTVADVVPLDANNRILVSNGLKRIRAGRARHGINAILAVGGKDPAKANSMDMGFIVGPRLNAAGRLDDMTRGISCLLADSYEVALEKAKALDKLNRERREIESDMTAQAAIDIDELLEAGVHSNGIALYQPDWHQGVVGIVAARVRERTYRPSICFASAGDGEIRGSGRSIPGLHLRDCLDLVSKRHPDLILKFGGHSQAAGLSIKEANLQKFSQAFAKAVDDLLEPGALEQVIETDGELDECFMTVEAAALLEAPVWGQAFPAPSFLDEFFVESQRVVGEKHLKLKLRKGNIWIDAMRFGSPDELPEVIRAAYRISINEWNGRKTVQAVLEYAEPA